MDARRGEGVLLALVLVALCWAACAHRARAQGRDDLEAMKQAIIARERAQLKAMNDDNASFFDDFFTDDYTSFAWWDSNLAQPKARENVQGIMRSNPGRLRDVIYGMAHEHVQLYGDTAILTYNLSTSSSYTIGGGQHTTCTLDKVTSVYIRQKNVWRLAHSHSSTTTAPPVPLPR